MMVFVHGAESFIDDASNTPKTLVPNLSCDSASDQEASQESRWTLGETFHKYVRAFARRPTNIGQLFTPGHRA